MMMMSEEAELQHSTVRYNVLILCPSMFNDVDMINKLNIRKYMIYTEKSPLQRMTS